MHCNQLLTSALLSLVCATSVQAKDAKMMPYKAPDMNTFIKLENAFSQAFKTGDLAVLKTFYQLKGQEKPASVLHSNDNLGWGQVTINHTDENPVFLQVPHRYHDKWTVDIAEHWLKTGRFKAAMVNSVHRYAGKNAKPKVNSDFTTAANSPFLAATRAFISSFTDPLIIQLHGFDKSKRRSEQVQSADVILSHGAKLPDVYLNRLEAATACIQTQMSVNALVYPKTVNELGATKNLMGKALRKMGYYQQFIHVELSGEIRNKLRQSPKLSVQLLDCITGFE
jgi:hypothetical protein